MFVAFLLGAVRESPLQGVVKLGWSWENRFVVTFNSQSHLQARLKELMNQPGCLATYCIVQEGHFFDRNFRTGNLQLSELFFFFMQSNQLLLSLLSVVFVVVVVVVL